MPQSDFWPFSTKNKAVAADSTGQPSVLQKQLGDMEGEVKEMQMELAAIKRNRVDLQNRTTNDFLYPIAKLKAELIKAKNITDEERFQREKYEAKLKDLELKLNMLCGGESITQYKDTRKESDQEVVVAMKQQMRDMKEEMEEMKMTVVEKSEQLQEYRVKYLQAQQQVEELKRQMDVVEYDNKQVSDQIQIEIQKMKMQFQEKLQELAPLPDLLKGAQFQLQEAKQLQHLAEDSSQQLSNELHRVKEKLVEAVNNFNQEKADRLKYMDENKTLKTTVDEQKIDLDLLHKQADDYKCQVLRLEEKLDLLENRYKEKTAECAQLLKDLDEMRLENSRAVGRYKERSDSMRRYLQTQISELERQLIQSRAQCRACQKERDDVRQRMQIQINSLQENFELVEIRLNALKNQVTSLKSSYTIILAEEEESSDFNKITTT
ncbi:outer dense fiber protein 2-like isoform X2 [Plodia interpunctella]|uniref:outer dense fiber protein 2-like isoform X2 n=1 Tax=Plodia interpunctella TaxID=58824 RepID=UPI0023680701|nr:outer dense fiber protein 2-like isoform X2 [Plodia interpunctella]